MTVTIRADRYEPLQTAPELAGIQSEVFDELKPMPPAGYFEVITGPARRATAAGRPLSIQPALVERLLADGAQGADALPLLALTLQQLYHDFGADGELSVADYEAMGGMATVVQTEVYSLLAADPDQRQAQIELLHDAFIPWLATINRDNDQPMRRLARYTDLPAASHSLIEGFVEKRLLVKDTRGGRCQLGWGSAGSGRAGARWAGCRWYGSGCGSQSGDLVPDGESWGHFGAIVISAEAMATGPEVRRDHAEHRQEPLGSAGCAEAFHGAFAVPGRLVRVLRPVEFRYLDCRCSTDGITSRCATP